MHDNRVDDTVDVVHGHQQLSLFNAHYYRRCFLPIHVYDAATCRPVAMVLRLGKTPTGEEIRGYLRRLVRRIRARWPTTRILIRGDGHYGRAHVMARCENNGVDYPFGQPGNKVLQRLVDESADDIRTRRALERKSVLRGYAETATRRNPGRRNVAPALASRQPRWPRHPLRRHQSRQRLRRAHLRRDLLRPRPGRKPDQDAQEPARLRPYLLPLTDCQPGPSCPARRRILADAYPARRRCPRRIICAAPSWLRCGSGCSSSALDRASRPHIWAHRSRCVICLKNRLSRGRSTYVATASQPVSASVGFAVPADRQRGCRGAARPAVVFAPGA
ncbi:hypothetical protein MPLA_680024 [Mesorhizobium sp. ORS 3359]|nr:hypothetical protein MPLA_680024 [Mesorhizobium sp. ORS 3359]